MTTMLIKDQRLFSNYGRTKETYVESSYQITKPDNFKVKRVYATINHYTCGARINGKMPCDEKDIELEF